MQRLTYRLPLCPFALSSRFDAVFALIFLLFRAQEDVVAHRRILSSAAAERGASLKFDAARLRTVHHAALISFISPDWPPIDRQPALIFPGYRSKDFASYRGRRQEMDAVHAQHVTLERYYAALMLPTRI